MEWISKLIESLKEIRPIIYVVIGVLIAAAVVLIIVVSKKNSTERKGWTAHQLGVGALCIAIAFVLSYFKLFSMPQGGSITLASMLPIMMFGYIYGIKKGLLVGLAYGILQMFQDLYAVHWLQIVLDYGVAFMALALAGLFRKKVSPGTFFFGMLIAGIVRFAAHTVSGVVFFAEYAPIGQNVWLYSMGYNSFVFVDLAICIVIGMAFAITRIIKPLKLREDAE